MCTYKNDESVEVESQQFDVDMKIVDGVRMDSGSKLNIVNVCPYNLQTQSESLFVEVSTTLTINVAIKKVLERREDKMIVRITRGVMKKTCKQVFLLEISAKQLQRVQRHHLKLPKRLAL